MEIQIKLGFDEISNDEATIKGLLYAEGTVANPNFPGADIIAQGVVVKAATVDLVAAIAQPQSPTRTAEIKVARNAWEKEVRKLTQLQQVVVSASEATDAEKLVMIQSANREAVEIAVHQKYKFTVKQGPNSGEVVCTAETEDAVAHLYTWATDLINYKDKADPWESASAKTTAHGVPINTELAFFHKGIYTNKRVDWEGPIFLTVH